MATFVLHCLDKTDSLDLRMATRERHLAYVRPQLDILKLGGPHLDDNGDMAGSLMIIDVPDRAAAEAFSAGDPYTKAGLWSRVEITPFRITLGQL